VAVFTGIQSQTVKFIPLTYFELLLVLLDWNTHLLKNQPLPVQQIAATKAILSISFKLTFEEVAGFKIMSIFSKY
jgi:hypothetical protein